MESSGGGTSSSVSTPTAPAVGTTRVFHFPLSVSELTLYAAFLEESTQLGYRVLEKTEFSFLVVVPPSRVVRKLSRNFEDSDLVNIREDYHWGGRGHPLWWRCLTGTGRKTTKNQSGGRGAENNQKSSTAGGEPLGGYEIFQTVTGGVQGRIDVVASGEAGAATNQTGAATKTSAPPGQLSRGTNSSTSSENGDGEIDVHHVSVRTKSNPSNNPASDPPTTEFSSNQNAPVAGSLTITAVSSTTATGDHPPPPFKTVMRISADSHCRVLFVYSIFDYKLTAALEARFAKVNKVVLFATALPRPVSGIGNAGVGVIDPLTSAQLYGVKRGSGPVRVMQTVTSFEKDPRHFKREIAAYYFFTKVLTNEAEYPEPAKLAKNGFSDFAQECEKECGRLELLLDEFGGGSSSVRGRGDEINPPGDEMETKRTAGDQHRAFSRKLVELQTSTEQSIAGIFPQVGGPTSPRTGATPSFRRAPYNPFQRARSIMKQLEKSLAENRSLILGPSPTEQGEYLWDARSSAVAKFVLSKTLVPLICQWYHLRYFLEDAHYQKCVTALQPLLDVEVEESGVPLSSGRSNQTTIFDRLDIPELRGSYSNTTNLLNQLAASHGMSASSTSTTPKVYAPLELVEKLLAVRTEMKLEATLSLHAMDETLPLFISVFAKSDLRKPFFLSNLLLDWMSPEQQAESEGQIVTLLQSAAAALCQEGFVEDLLYGGSSGGGSQGANIIGAGGSDVGEQSDHVPVGRSELAVEAVEELVKSQSNSARASPVASVAVACLEGFSSRGSPDEGRSATGAVATGGPLVPGLAGKTSGMNKSGDDLLSPKALHEEASVAPELTGVVGEEGR